MCLTLIRSTGRPAGRRQCPRNALPNFSSRKWWSKYSNRNEVQAIRCAVFPPLPISQTYRARVKACCHVPVSAARVAGPPVMS